MESLNRDRLILTGVFQQADTLYYPGDSAAMRMSVRQLRVHAHMMRRVSVSADSTPAIPLINGVMRDGPNDVLVWRGTAVAASYTIERSTLGAGGPWTIICDKCATDTSTPWPDTTTPEGAVWYRVIAYNLSGVASRPSSPYQAGSAEGIAVDNLDDYSKPTITAAI